MICNESYYGAYRTRTFAEIFPTYDLFFNELDKGPFAGFNTGSIKEEELKRIYYGLYATYGNSHIAFSDENQFKAGVFMVIFDYGDTYITKQRVQDKLRALAENEDELLKGSKAIYNHAYNPSAEPSTQALRELEYINDQNTTNYVKSRVMAYGEVLSLLRTNLLKDLMRQFAHLFLAVVAPDYNLLYETEIS